MSTPTQLHIQIDEETRSQASKALTSLGLSVSDAVRILLKRIARDQEFPLELKIPNAETRAAMEEARTMAASCFNSAADLFDALEKDSQKQEGRIAASL